MITILGLLLFFLALVGSIATITTLVAAAIGSLSNEIARVHNKIEIEDTEFSMKWFLILSLITSFLWTCVFYIYCVR
jgi:hypothetical protein